MPSVSVVLPVNRMSAKFRRVYASVLQQSFSDFELVLIDSRSRAEKRVSIEELVDTESHVKVIDLDDWSTNPSSAILHLLAGRYVAFHDAGTKSDPSRLQKQIAHLENNPTTGIIGCQIQGISKTQEFNYPVSPAQAAWQLIWQPAVSLSTALVRKSLIEKLGPVDLIDPVSWYEFCTKVAWYAKQQNLPETLVERIMYFKEEARQEQAFEEVSHRYLSSILDYDVPRTEITWLHHALRRDSPLQEWQIRKLMNLLDDVYRSLIDGAFYTQDERLDLRDAMMSCFVSLSRSTESYQTSIPASDIASVYWQNRLPRWMFEAGRYLRHLELKGINRQRILRGPKPNPKNEKPKVTSSQQVSTPLERGRSLSRSQKTRSPAVDTLSVIILSHKRMRSFALLLQSLLEQLLVAVDLEIIICNNDPGRRLDPQEEGGNNKLLREFADLKVFNSTYNWRCDVRYAAALLARSDRILFLDDDVVLKDRTFLSHLIEAHASLAPADLISCWTHLWVAYDDQYLTEVMPVFSSPTIDQLTLVDVAGPGICMFRKDLLFDKRLWQSVTDPLADDMSFSIIANIVWDSQSYYVPSYGMLEFHDEWQKEALFHRPQHNEKLYAQYKSLWREGYKPAVERAGSSTPTDLAARILSSKRWAW